MLAATVGVAFGHGSDIIAESAGAIGQEVIDLLAVLNAIRVALPAGKQTDI